MFAIALPFYVIDWIWGTSITSSTDAAWYRNVGWPLVSAVVAFHVLKVFINNVAHGRAFHDRGR